MSNRPCCGACSRSTSSQAFTSRRSRSPRWRQRARSRSSHSGRVRRTPGEPGLHGFQGGISAATRVLAIDHARDGIRERPRARRHDTPLMWANVAADDVDRMRGVPHSEIPIGRLADPREPALAALLAALRRGELRDRIAPGVRWRRRGAQRDLGVARFGLRFRPPCNLGRRTRSHPNGSEAARAPDLPGAGLGSHGLL